MMKKKESIHQKSLRLLNEFLSGISKKELKKIIKKHEDMNIEGPTFDEYLKYL